MIGRFERILLVAATLLTGATGLIFAWMKFLVKNSDPFSVVNHPWQPYFLSAHVLAAPILLFAFGLIAREHVVSRYRDTRARRGRRTGILAVWIGLFMVVSGYALQVLTSQAPRSAIGLGHLGAGMLFLLLLSAHSLLGRRGSASDGILRNNGRGRKRRAGD